MNTITAKTMTAAKTAKTPADPVAELFSARLALEAIPPGDAGEDGALDRLDAAYDALTAEQLARAAFIARSIVRGCTETQ